MSIYGLPVPRPCEWCEEKSDRDLALKNVKSNKWDKACTQIRICKISDDKCHKKRTDQVLLGSVCIKVQWGLLIILQTLKAVHRALYPLGWVDGNSDSSFKIKLHWSIEGICCLKWCKWKALCKLQNAGQILLYLTQNFEKHTCLGT